MTRPAKTAALEALIEAHAVELKLPTVRRRFREFAADAIREQQTPVAYLAALLDAEVRERAERRERRRLIDARFPLIKRLEDFVFADNPNVPQATIAALAEGTWIDDRESILFVGESGSGKTHLATALAVCACRQGRRVRFTTLAALANELQEAESRRELARVVGRYARTELVVLDELGTFTPGRRRRARLPGPLRTPRARQPDRHHQPPLRRVDQGLPRPPPSEGSRRPPHPQGPHHRHRQ
jgi:DNA replication protein DnaC